MNYDPALLDELARVFAEAALRTLETQTPADTAAPGGNYSMREQYSGSRLERQPCNTLFQVADHHQGPRPEAADRPHLQL